jgi:hypothetical protein
LKEQRAAAIEASKPKPLRDEAYHGIVGELVRQLEPLTEAHPAAMLVCALTCFGNLIGRRSHFYVSADKHHANLFALVVGRSSKGRKGMAFNIVKHFFTTIDPEWKRNIGGGLSSGEGLIADLQDPEPPEDEDAELPHIDKRRLLVETEFATVLERMKIQGNTVDSIIRQGWDGEDLRTRTKNTPLLATEPHISIIGNITFRELNARLSNVSIANGFANRFLFVYTERANSLPQPCRIETSSPEWQPFVRSLRQAVTFATNHAPAGDLGDLLDPEASTFWDALYDALEYEGDEEDPAAATVAEATNRGTANIMRLALIYALLDSSPVVKLEHLAAAEAVWEYCYASAAYVFRGSAGDPLADRIYAAIRERHPERVSRTTISRLPRRPRREGRAG